MCVCKDCSGASPLRAADGSGPEMNNEGLLTTGKVAAIYDVSASKVRYWCDHDADPLPNVRPARPGGHRRIPKLFLAAWADRHGWHEDNREADPKRDPS